MNLAILVPAAAAIVGYTRPRAKRKKIPSALLWGLGAFVGWRLAAPYLVQMGLPARI